MWALNRNLRAWLWPPQDGYAGQAASTETIIFMGKVRLLGD